MKRILIFASIAFIFLLSNCSSNKSAETKTTETKVIQLTTESFKQKVFNFEANKEWKFEGNKPVVIDFYATWCGPCKQMAPIMDELANEFDGKVVFYKMDVDVEQLVAQTFGIQSIPAFLLVPASGQPQFLQGAMPKENFVKAINDVLKVK